MKRTYSFYCRALRWSVVALLLLAVSMAANAYSFKVDDIYYNIISSKICEVTYKDTKYNSYSGNVVIPETVKYSGTTYTVTAIGDDAFCKCTKLTEVTIPNSVTSIGSYAFCECTGLTEVTIPNNVTKIGSYAFYECSGLTEITIPNSVTSIGSYAFYNCTGLMCELIIPESVTEIGKYAFGFCWRLTGELIIPNGMTSIGDGTFDNCQGLTGELTIPNSVTTIGSRAFCGTSLTSVTIPESVTKIGGRAFSDCWDMTKLEVAEGNEYYCAVDGVLFTKDMTTLIQFPAGSSITSYDIPESVTEIGSYAFCGCSGLTSITIPNSVTTISDYVFDEYSGLTEMNFNATACTSVSSDVSLSKCENLTTVNIGNNVTEIPSHLFRSCTSLTEVNFNATACTSAGSSSSNRAFYGCDNISTFNFGNNVTIIPDYLCYELTCLTSVTIPNSVTEIGSGAFYNCTGLTEVNFNATACTSAGSSSSDCAFCSCSNISAFNFGDTVTIIPDYLCYKLTELTEVTIPNYVTEIGSYAFHSCSGLTGELIIPNSVNEIGSYAFHSCSGLTGELIIPNSVNEIGKGAFRNCSGFTSVTIPEGVTSIGEQAFYNCTGLTTLNFNAIASTHVYSQPYYACLFENCGNLTTVNFGDNVTIIPEFLCSELTKLTEVTIPKNVTTIKYSAFRSCTGLTSITIGDSVETISREAFYNCTGLTIVTIPNSVTEIGYGAFSYCSGLTSVTIGNSVETMYGYAFAYCTGLTSIYSLNPEPPTCSSYYYGVFYDVPTSNCVLYVPEGSKEAYSTAYAWEDFLNIVEMDMTPVSGITAGGNAETTGYYTTDGKHVPTPQRGINIIRYSDGTTKKVLVK